MSNFNYVSKSHISNSFNIMEREIKDQLNSLPDELPFLEDKFRWQHTLEVLEALHSSLICSDVS